MTRTRPDPAEPPQIVLLGVAAGLIAATATTAFEAAWGRARLPPTATKPPAPPPTEKLADAIGRMLTGEHLPRKVLGPAGALVHYAMGGALGLAYAVGRRRHLQIGAARGVAFGLAVWALVEEAALSLVGLKPPPWRAGAGRRLFSISAHATFGLALDTALAALLRARGLAR